MEKQYIIDNYKLWLEKATQDENLNAELLAISSNYEKKEDAFYRNLSFGTGGLRGVIGAGTNRINIYTIAKTSQGLARYIIDNFSNEQHKVAISYDTRIKSDVFAKISATVFAANGIKVYIYTENMPTPCLSFAVRELNCCNGVMITASHNPAKYNGYKVYGSDGCQITTKAADEILKHIEQVDIFNDVKNMDFNTALENKQIEFIDASVYTSYTAKVKEQTTLNACANVDKNVSIVYTPLNGTGLKPVLRALKESGFTNINVVKEQEKPDGNFTTCPYPNPEIQEAMQLGISCAKANNADLLLATDPDCDRVGIAVKDNTGDYRLFSGNEVGVLLLDYIAQRKIATKTMPKEPVAMKTIVTTDMVKLVAKKYGIKIIDLLTGFKYIGESIGKLEEQKKEDDFLFGLEESYGYLAGTYVRDKDAVVACLLIAEMFAFYAQQKVTLIEKLNALYAEFGFTLNTQHSFKFEGLQGFNKMQDIMAFFRKGLANIGEYEVLQMLDYKQGIDDLPKADVIKYELCDNCSIIIRPSGTEPKLKIYVSITAKDENLAKAKETVLIANLKEYLR